MPGRSPAASAPKCTACSCPRYPARTSSSNSFTRNCCGHKGAVLPRPGHDAVRARRPGHRFGELEDHPVRRLRSPIPWSGPDLQRSGLAARGLRERLPLRRDMARLPADGRDPALCRAGPPVGGDTMWVNMPRLRAAAPAGQRADRRSTCPAQHRVDLGARLPIDKRLELSGTVPRRRASRGAYASGDRREDPLRQQLHHPFHELSHRRQRPHRTRLRTRCRRSC